MGIETALLGSAIVGGASSFFGGQAAAKGAKKAAKLQAQQYAENKANLSPYISAGNNSMAAYLTSLGLSGDTDEAKRANQQKFFDDFQYDPGFQRFLDDTNKNTMRSYSLYGDTGGNLVDGVRKNSEGAIYGQFQDRRNALGALANQGQSAALGLANNGTTSAANQGQFLSNAGQFQAAGIIGAGQAGVNAFGNYAKGQANQNGFAAGSNPWLTQTVNRASF